MINKDGKLIVLVNEMDEYEIGGVVEIFGIIGLVTI